MLGKSIYVVEGWIKGTKDHAFYFDVLHEAQAFFEVVSLKHYKYEWFLEEKVIYAHSADALKSIEDVDQ